MLVCTVDSGYCILVQEGDKGCRQEEVCLNLVDRFDYETSTIDKSPNALICPLPMQTNSEFSTDRSLEV